MQAAVATLPKGAFRQSTDFKKNHLCQPRHSKRSRKTAKELKHDKLYRALTDFNFIQGKRAQLEMEKSHSIQFACANETWMNLEKEYLYFKKERRELNKVHTGYQSQFETNDLTREEDLHWSSIKAAIAVYDILLNENLKCTKNAYSRVLKIEEANPTKKPVPSTAVGKKKPAPSTAVGRDVDFVCPPAVDKSL